MLQTIFSYSIANNLSRFVFSEVCDSVSKNTVITIFKLSHKVLLNFPAEQGISKTASNLAKFIDELSVGKRALFFTKEEDELLFLGVCETISRFTEWE
jgi:hypothetical protein